MPLIREARTLTDIEQARRLFREYQAVIGVDLCFQGFAEELASLPGCYAPPAGRLLLAVEDDSVLGCVAIRLVRDGDCEMKRLYVRPSGRGRGIGRLLATTSLGEARHAGYHRVLLDTLPSMSEALALYHSLGFSEVPPYYHNPIPGALYFALSLKAA
jgi:putative acetyltransferase